MPISAFDLLLNETRKAHSAFPELNGFCSFPDDLKAQSPAPYRINAAQLMVDNPGETRADLEPLRDAFLAASDLATWRETYKFSDIGEDFMSRFGCYCLIGQGGGWISRQMASYVVYMPPGLYYPWHHHPAEELYFVIAGQAEFLRSGAASETLGPGESSFHESNQPHAMRTLDQPVMAYVLWRSDLDVPPVLTEPDKARSLS